MLLMLLLAGIFFCLFLFPFQEKFIFVVQQGALLGREGDIDSITSLSGRIGLWKDLFEYVAKRPLLGYGYRSFWTPQIIKSFGHEEFFYHAHSAFIDIALSLGLVGMISYILMLASGIHRAFALQRMAQSTDYGALGLFFVFCFIEGLTESIIVYPCMANFFSMVVFARLGFYALD